MFFSGKNRLRVMSPVRKTQIRPERVKIDFWKIKSSWLDSSILHFRSILFGFLKQKKKLNRRCRWILLHDFVNDPIFSLPSHDLFLITNEIFSILISLVFLGISTSFCLFTDFAVESVNFWFKYAYIYLNQLTFILVGNLKIQSKKINLCFPAKSKSVAVVYVNEPFLQRMLKDSSFRHM